MVCAACGNAVQRPCEHDHGHSIDRDGFGVGPEVPLCCACGADETPTCEELWDAISARKVVSLDSRRNTKSCR